MFVCIVSIFIYIYIFFFIYQYCNTSPRHCLSNINKTHELTDCANTTMIVWVENIQSLQVIFAKTSEIHSMPPMAAASPIFVHFFIQRSPMNVPLDALRGMLYIEISVLYKMIV